MRRVLATDLGIWPMLQHLERASDAMVASPDYWARLANYVLLYDQIIIPTGNFQILPVLRLMLGEDAFDDLIRNKGIVLARFDKWFGYGGNGAGIVFFSIHDGPKSHARGPNLGAAFFKPIDEAIDVALAATNPPSNNERRAEIKNLILDNIVQLPTEQITKGLKEETYNDILKSPYLRDFLALRNAGRSLNRLIGIGPDKLTIFNPHIPPEKADSLEIRAVLRAAFENYLLSIGGFSEATEITGDESTLSILRAKGERIGFSTEGDQAFAKILKVSGIPDLGMAYASKQLSSAQLLDLRYSKNTQALRDWFAVGAPRETADETLHRYVESVGKPSWLETIPMKVFRFATTMGISAVEPVSGAVASAIDNFLLSNWFPKRTPRLFMKQAKTMLTNSPVIKKPVMKGRDRNSPCSCGSGKKYKKCCER